MSMYVEEFPMALLKDDADRINRASKEIQDQIIRIRGIEAESQSFQQTLDELEESVNRWSEKSQMLTDKAKDQPTYENADHFLSHDTKPNLEWAELIVRNLKAKKCMETNLGENMPNPEATAESMSHIRTLLAEFINDDKSSF